MAARDWILRLDGGDVVMRESRGRRRKASKTGRHGDDSRPVGPNPIRLWLQELLADWAQAVTVRCVMSRVVFDFP